MYMYHMLKLVAFGTRHSRLKWLYVHVSLTLTCDVFMIFYTLQKKTLHCKDNSTIVLHYDNSYNNVANTSPKEKYLAAIAFLFLYTILT